MREEINLFDIACIALATVKGNLDHQNTELTAWKFQSDSEHVNIGSAK
jgi:hypothetical protein